MYVPPHFSTQDTESIELIRAYPLGVLVTHGEHGLDANHLPFHLEIDPAGQIQLHAHVARRNTVWRDLTDGDEVLVIFRAGDAYISPNWYPSKHETHRQVPTWNYMVAHAHGTVRIMDNARYVRGVVARLTRTHEASQTRPWKMTDSAPEYIDEQLQAIVGLQISVTRLVGKHKLSQNKDTRDLASAAEGVIQAGDAIVGDAMAAHAASRGEGPD